MKEGVVNDKQDSHKSGSDGEKVEPLVVLEFSASASQAAIEWLMAKLQAPKADGGADLYVQTIYLQHNKGIRNCTDLLETMLLVSATSERLLLAAEIQEMKKLHSDGFHREVTVQDIEGFANSEDLDSFFTQAEKQKLIYKEIENIRAGELDLHIPGYEQHKLYPGKSIIKKYLSRQVVIQMFPLHDEEKIKRLGDEWYQPKWFFRKQPIGKFTDSLINLFWYFGMLKVLSLSRQSNMYKSLV